MENKGADTLPFFLQKLWQIVCDPGIDRLICWSEDGSAFFVLVPEQFSHEVLPQYFKHRNFSSFVRQLNMYGFHKIVSTENGLAAAGEEIGFSHPSFIRGKPELLDQIKRKVNARNVQLVQHASQMSRDDLDSLMKSLHELKNRQDQVVSALSSLTQDKDGLWSEVLTLRQQVSRQDTVIKKLLGFIGQCVTFGSLPMKRPHLAITQTGDLDGSQYKVGSMTNPPLSQDQYAAASAAAAAHASSMSPPISTTSEDIFVKPSKVTIEDDNDVDVDDLDYLFSTPSAGLGTLIPNMSVSTATNTTTLAQPSTMPSVPTSAIPSTSAAYATSSAMSSTLDANSQAAALAAATAAAENYRITAPKPNNDLNPKCIHSCGEHIDNVQVGIEGMQKYLSSTLGPAAVDQLFDDAGDLAESLQSEILMSNSQVDPFTGVPIASPPGVSNVIPSAVQHP